VRPDRGRALSPVVLVLAGLALALLVLPLAALLIRAPWGDLGSLLTSPAVGQALLLSLVTATIATVLCLVLGIPLAILLARAEGWPVLPRRLLRVAVTIPLGRRGVLGSLLADMGVGITYTTGAVVLAQTFVSMPFLVFAVEGALRTADRRVELAAATLGASRGQVFRLITLRLVAPGVAAGAVLCFTRALGEFGATITFAGSLPGVTRTLPIASYLALQREPGQAIALAIVLLVVSVVVLFALRDRWMPGVGR
jgi:molybdate transport system permease protein